MMPFIWIATILANGVLAITLAWREHSQRYHWLFLSSVLATFADAILWFSRTYDHAHYDIFRTVAHWLFLFLNFAIIAEALRWRNTRIALPMSIYVGSTFIALGMKSMGYLWTAYYMLHVISYFTLATTIWFIIIFSKRRFA